MESAFLGPRQKRILAAALTLAGLVVIGWSVFFAVAQFSAMLRLFAPMLWPLATAGILALLLRPVVGVLEARLRLTRGVAVILLYLLVLLVTAGVLLALVPILVGQATDLLSRLPAIFVRGEQFLRASFPDWVVWYDTNIPGPKLSEMLPGLVEEARTGIVDALPTFADLGSQVLGIFGAIAGAAIVPVYLFYFLLGTTNGIGRLGDQLPFLAPEARADVVFLVDEFVNIVTAFFRGQLLIGLIMGVLLAIGFSAIGLRFGLLLGLAMGVLNVVPYLGSIIGMAIALPMGLAQDDGGWWLAGGIVLVFTAVQSIEGWYLTPKIMGESTGLHPVAVIVSIFFWGIALGGILGMVLAIPLSAFFVTAWRLAKRKYFVAPA